MGIAVIYRDSVPLESLFGVEIHVADDVSTREDVPTVKHQSCSRVSVTI